MSTHGDKLGSVSCMTTKPRTSEIKILVLNPRTNHRVFCKIQVYLDMKLQRNLARLNGIPFRL